MNYQDQDFQTFAFVFTRVQFLKPGRLRPERGSTYVIVSYNP